MRSKDKAVAFLLLFVLGKKGKDKALSQSLFFLPLFYFFYFFYYFILFYFKIHMRFCSVWLGGKVWERIRKLKVDFFFCMIF